MQTTVVGGYPKIIENQLLRKTLWQIDQEGGIANGKLEKTLQTVTRSAIREQEEAGIDIVSDGAIRWEDEVTPMFRGMDGRKITGLIRYFDTNCLYRQPVVTGDLKWKGAVLDQEFTWASKETKRPLKAILTGPFTLAKCSVDEHYQSFEKLTLAIAEGLSQEMKALTEAGAKKIHINEPFILHSEGEFDLFKRAIERVVKGISAEVTLYFSYGDFAKIFPKVLELPVARVGFDFIYTPHAKEIAGNAAWTGKKFLGGIVDARNTKIETEQEIFSALESITSRFSSDDVEISPSNSLEFLPIDRCRAKLKNMTSLVARFKEGK
jgi:5-methyltetrahydropteroyltriglutamate--homocysteine methyltransferase